MAGLIRVASKNDIDTISEIEQTCWGSNGASKKDFLNFFDDNIKNSTINIYENSMQTLGFIGYFLQANEGSIYIWNLAIKLDSIRQGIARKLILDTQQLAKSAGLSSINLKVSDLNFSAVGLYKKLDFKELSRELNYYPDGSTALSLSFSL